MKSGPPRWTPSQRWSDWLAAAVFAYLAWPPLQMIIRGAVSPYLILMFVFYLTLVLVYLFHSPPNIPARGWLERYLPLAVTFAPAVVFRIHPDAEPPAAALLLCTTGVALALWGLSALRGNFSIMAEGRALITNGPYRWLRHPIYLGEIITLAGLVWLSPHAITILGAAAIAAGQLWRAAIEERKLQQCFGEKFLDYRRKSWWFTIPEPR